MTIRIGDTCPNFVALSTQGTIDFHDWLNGSWAMLFSHPGDFTPVCTTEVGCVSKLENEFAMRNVKTIGLSTDTIEEHLSWIDDINSSQHTDMFVPIISDPDGKIASRYGMLHSGFFSDHTVRSVFIIDPSMRIRMYMSYPAEVGRSFDEILRVIDALQYADEYQVVTPADWLPGDKAIIAPQISDRLAAILFPQGWKAPLPYLRYVRT